MRLVKGMNVRSSKVRQGRGKVDDNNKEETMLTKELGYYSFMVRRMTISGVH